MAINTKLVAFGGASLILMTGLVSAIVGYIVLYRVLTISSADIKDPKVKDTLELLKKCALGAFICLALRIKGLAELSGLAYLILLLIMTISILKLSDSQASLHPDLSFLKKMSLIYVIALGVTFGLAFIGGGVTYHFKRLRQQQLDLLINS